MDTLKITNKNSFAVKNRLINFILPMLLYTLQSCLRPQEKPATLLWSQLPLLPDPIGFAGSFVGVSNGALLVAGGANFGPGGTPWNGAKKIWYDQIFALKKPTGKWRIVGRLPHSMGYGVSLSWKDGLICIGGNNASGYYNEAFIVKYTSDTIAIEHLPPLPSAAANASGVLIDNTIYIAGGQKDADSETAKFFWALDLSVTSRKWKALPAWPGPSRMLAVAGAQNGAFYLFGGTALVPDKEGNLQRRFLTDAYKYQPEQGWIKLADLPEPMVAAPSPAFTDQHSNLLVFGGDNGRYFRENDSLKDSHPGFSDKIWAYDSLRDTWFQAGVIKTHKGSDAAQNPNASIWAPVTTPLTVWNGTVILAGGEVRPGTRTPRVLSVSFETDH